MSYDELVELLKNAGHQTRCNDLISWLEAAGFTLRKGNSGNHYTFIHEYLIDAGFFGGGFDCGHGKTPQVKKPYITKILNHVVRKYEMELRDYLGEQS